MSITFAECVSSEEIKKIDITLKKYSSFACRLTENNRKLKVSFSDEKLLTVLLDIVQSKKKSSISSTCPQLPTIISPSHPCINSLFTGLPHPKNKDTKKNIDNRVKLIEQILNLPEDSVYIQQSCIVFRKNLKQKQDKEGHEYCVKKLVTNLLEKLKPYSRDLGCMEASFDRNSGETVYKILIAYGYNKLESTLQKIANEGSVHLTVSPRFL